MLITGRNEQLDANDAEKKKRKIKWRGGRGRRGAAPRLTAAAEPPLDPRAGIELQKRFFIPHYIAGQETLPHPPPPLPIKVSGAVESRLIIHTAARFVPPPPLPCPPPLPAFFSRCPFRGNFESGSPLSKNQSPVPGRVFVACVACGPRSHDNGGGRSGPNAPLSRLSAISI